MANFVQSSSNVGLQAATVNIPAAGLYNFIGTLTLPSAESPAVSQGPGGGAGTGSGGAPKVPSQVIVTIRQNGSAIFTSQAGDKGFDLIAVLCAANDIITFTPASSLASDQQPNAVRMTLAVSQGPQ